MTKSLSKSMLPMGNKEQGIKPIIYWIVEDIHDAGIDEVILVVSPRNKDIVNYFKEDEQLKEKVKEKPFLLDKLHRTHCIPEMYLST